MRRNKLLAIGAVTAALVAGPVAAPASAQPTVGVNLPCEVFAEPYGYPCQTAEDTVVFVRGEAGDAVEFVVAVRDEAGRIVFDVYCTVFPNQPECW